jgi:hypothetical protein
VIYSLLDDANDVDLFRTINSLISRIDCSNLFLDHDNTQPATEQSISRQLRKSGTVRLYKESQNDWKYKIEAHRKARR